MNRNRKRKNNSFGWLTLGGYKIEHFTFIRHDYDTWWVVAACGHAGWATFEEVAANPEPDQTCIKCRKAINRFAAQVNT